MNAAGEIRVVCKKAGLPCQNDRFKTKFNEAGKTNEYYLENYKNEDDKIPCWFPSMQTEFHWYPAWIERKYLEFIIEK